MSKPHVIGLFAIVASLAGCGGGSSSAPQPDATEAVSPQASASAAGLVGYLGKLKSMQGDDKEAVDLAGFSPVTPEDTEPEPVE